MAIIAIAGGTGGLGKTFVKAFSQTPHKIIVLTRTAQKSLFPNTKYVQVDYTSIPALHSLLETNNISTIISAITMNTPLTSTAQLNLIAAANASQTTKRFIPSEYGVIASPATLNLDLYAKYTLQSADALSKTTLQYSRIAVGWLMDYWGMPHLAGEMARFRWALDIENGVARIPGRGEERFSMTYSYDLARFVIRLLEEEDWPVLTGVVGQDVSFNQLVGWAESARGKKFEVGYDELEKLERGEVSLFEETEGAVPQFNGELSVLFGRLLVEGHVLLPEEGFRLNERFPELEVLTVENMIQENWTKRA